MKKTIYLLILILSLTSCEIGSSTSHTSSGSSVSNSGEVGNSSRGENEEIITFFSLNDVHGSIEQSGEEPGMSRVISKVKQIQVQDSARSSYLFAVGDMFQGSALSNITKGEAMTSVMNTYVDASTVGNHDFDWGQESLKNIVSKSSFPVLGANVYYTATNKKVDFLKASTIIEKNNFKLGVVGTISSNIESSIATTMLKGIYFENQAALVKKEATRLKTVENCDAVILLSHDGGSDEVVSDILSASSDVDAAMLGHSHQAFAQISPGGKPYVQAGGNGKNLAKLTYNTTTKKFKGLTYDLRNLTIEEDETTKVIVNQYKEIVGPIINKVIGKLEGGSLQRYGDRSLGNFVTDVLLKFGRTVASSNVVAAIHNIAGVRADYLNEGNVVLGDIYKLMPFDNEIRIVSITGASLLRAHTGKTYNFSSGITEINGQYYLGAKVIVASQHYDVISIDYLTTKESGDLAVPGGGIQTFKYVRDILVEEFDNAPNKTINAATYRR